MEKAEGAALTREAGGGLHSRQLGLENTRGEDVGNRSSGLSL